MKIKIKKISCILFFGEVLLLSATTFGAEKKIVCIGDSITQGVHLQPAEAYPAVLDSLRSGATVINSGVAGNTSSQGRVRFTADVLSHKPDYVVILFGTNDSIIDNPNTFNVPVATFKSNIEFMVQQTLAAGATPILCTLLPIIEEPYFERHPEANYLPYGGLDAVLQKYRQATIDVASKYNLRCVDLYSIFQKDLSLIRPAPDGVHPTAAGAAVIATQVNNVIPEPTILSIIIIGLSATVFRRNRLSHFH